MNNDRNQDPAEVVRGALDWDELPGEEWQDWVNEVVIPARAALDSLLDRLAKAEQHRPPDRRDVMPSEVAALHSHMPFPTTEYGHPEYRQRHDADCYFCALLDTIDRQTKQLATVEQERDEAKVQNELDRQEIAILRAMNSKWKSDMADAAIRLLNQETKR